MNRNYTQAALSTVVLFSVFFSLAGCSSSQHLGLKNKVTLKPQDIPSLYRSPTADDNIGEAVAKLQDGIQQAELAADADSIDNTEAIIAETLAADTLAADKLAAETPGDETLLTQTAQNTTEDQSDAKASATNSTAELNEEALAAEKIGNCEKINAEIAMIDAGLGEKAEDSPPQAKATAMQRLGSYFKDMAVETIKGPFQPVIQSVRAATNADEKDRIKAETASRGNVRRAYLMGYGQGLGCVDVEDGEPDIEALESDG
ncbi:hypothetical protein [Halioxenophilus aromaticivorans]|uniref:Lipoprotein n=1 Tax=Halioxenophilus aromaticivorans TaxID=1306992 RepID=A0AAV3U0K0_9ALTE